MLVNNVKMVDFEKVILKMGFQKVRLPSRDEWSLKEISLKANTTAH